MPRISESDLLLPALYVISTESKPNTTKIKDVLEAVFQPSGEDSNILAGRADTRFSQIVRNLLGSHYDSNGMRELAVKDADRIFHLTDKGAMLVEKHIEYLEYLFQNRFGYEDAVRIASSIVSTQGRKRQLYIYREADSVTEGSASVRESIVKERSRKLRDAALAHYTQDGKITCAVCGFDFEKTYGAVGKGYIQMHHEQPICQYSDEGFQRYMGEAIQHMKPVCANCHCMLHRSRDHILTIAELIQMMNNTDSDR